LSLGNGENIILRLIKTELRKSVRIVARLPVKKPYRKEFTGVILAAIEPRDTASAKVIENRGKNAVGLTVLENARGGDLTGIVRLNQVDLVKSLRTENPPLHCASG
jgi:hypothetical protein